MYFYISKEHNKDNNQCLKSSDPKQEPKHITFSDANNLYGHAMSKLLQTSGFNWVDPKNLDSNKCNRNNPKGSVLEVGLEILQKFVNYVMTIRFAPDKIEIKKINIV